MSKSYIEPKRLMVAGFKQLYKHDALGVVINCCRRWSSFLQWLMAREDTGYGNRGKAEL